MTYQGFAPMSGALENKVIRGKDSPHAGLVKAPLSWKLKNTLRKEHISGWLGVKVALLSTKFLPVTAMVSELKLKSFDKSEGVWTDYGVVGRRVVTNAGASYIVDAFQNTTELENMKYHGTGKQSGSTGEAVADTTLESEYTTQLNPDNTRATGTTAEGGTGNEYQSVATNTYDATLAEVREHGIFSGDATSGAGVLLDRTTFSVISLNSGDSLQSTYTLTIVPGS